MAKEIIPTDNIFYDIILGISNNEDVDADVTNRPIEQLAANIKFLKRLVSLLSDYDIDDVIAQLALKVNSSSINQPNGVAGLDANGKLRPEQAPSISISNTRTFNSVAERDTWSDAEEGDFAIIIGQTTYIRTSTGWQELPRPPSNGAVSSVNGKTGTVQLTALDVGAEPSFVKQTGFNKSFGYTANTVSEGNHTHDYSTITNKPAFFPPVQHSHTTAQVTGLDTFISNTNTALSNLAATNTTQDTVTNSIINNYKVVRQRFLSSGESVFTLGDTKTVFCVTLNGIDLDDGEFSQSGNQLNVPSAIVGDIIITYRQG